MVRIRTREEATLHKYITWACGDGHVHTRIWTEGPTVIHPYSKQVQEDELHVLQGVEDGATQTSQIKFQSPVLPNPNSGTVAGNASWNSVPFLSPSTSRETMIVSWPLNGFALHWKLQTVPALSMFKVVYCLAFTLNSCQGSYGASVPWINGLMNINQNDSKRIIKGRHPALTCNDFVSWC